MTGPSLSQILDPPRPASNAPPPPPPPPHQAPQPNLSAPPPLHPGASGSQQSIGHASLATVPESNSSYSYANDGLSAQQSGPSSTATAAPTQAATSSAPSRQNHGSNNLYACRDCGRSYSRPEHLVRHVQTHTLGRRFTCEICQKSFARKDLLRRHVANHDNDSPQKRRRTNSSPGAGRVSQACRPCAIARVKCDDSKPCRRCVNRKLTCVYSEAGPPSNVHHHLPPNLHATVTHDSNQSTVAAASAESGNSSSPASHSHAQSATSGPSSLPGASTKTTPYSQTTSFKPEESQLPTPETIMDQGMCELNHKTCSIGRFARANNGQSFTNGKSRRSEQRTHCTTCF